MRSRILRCPSCGRFTLGETCPQDSTKTVYTFPPRFSPEDKYGRFRILESIGGSQDEE